MNQRPRLFQWVKSMLRDIKKTLHLILGAPSYEAYLTHFQAHHPGEQPLNEQDFFRKANDEKYGDGKIRRCC